MKRYLLIALVAAVVYLIMANLENRKLLPDAVVGR